MGRDWREVSRAAHGGQGSMGNGSAMRAPPVGAWFADEPDRLVEQARLSALPTHAHPEGAAGAIAVAAAAAAAARGRKDLLAAALELTPQGKTRDGLERAHALGSDAPVDRAAQELG